MRTHRFARKHVGSSLLMISLCVSLRWAYHRYIEERSERVFPIGADVDYDWIDAHSLLLIRGAADARGINRWRLTKLNIDTRQ